MQRPAESADRFDIVEVKPDILSVLHAIDAWAGHVAAGDTDPISAAEAMGALARRAISTLNAAC